MRLYHSRFLVWPLLALALLLAACASPQSNPGLVQVAVEADGKSLAVQVAAGSSVQQALAAAGLSLGSLDRSDPPIYSRVSAGQSVRLVRVTEKFEVTREPVPFENQVLYNESLPEGKDHEVYIQEGKNGLREVVVRHVYEDGVEVSSSQVKSTVIEQPVAAIWMKGIQRPFAPVTVPGRLVYLRDGNAWMIEATTGNRRAVVTTGDLDGYIFSLSDDGSWLLFTRKAKTDGQINTLWAARIGDPKTDGTPASLIDLRIKNVIYFAEWLPGSNAQAAFSTVEPQVAAPGWRTNNDLRNVTIFKSRETYSSTVQLKENLGGVYPWWGISFAWANDALRLAYANDHAVGILDVEPGKNNSLQEKGLSAWLQFAPLKTYSDWAWVPGVSWGPDGKMLYSVSHFAPAGMVLPEESQLFDLSAIPLEGGSALPLAADVGMFAYPLASPRQTQPSGEQGYQVAYLQAALPHESATSHYQVCVMDRDGSNKRGLFPEAGVVGLNPQREWGQWSPAPLPGSDHWAIATIYEGNLWLVDASAGSPGCQPGQSPANEKIQAWQITGDGQTTRVAWK